MLIEFEMLASLTHILGEQIEHLRCLYSNTDRLIADDAHALITRMTQKQSAPPPQSAQALQTAFIQVKTTLTTALSYLSQHLLSPHPIQTTALKSLINTPPRSIYAQPSLQHALASWKQQTHSASITLIQSWQTRVRKTLKAIDLTQLTLSTNFFTDLDEQTLNASRALQHQIHAHHQTLSHTTDPHTPCTPIPQDEDLPHLDDYQILIDLYHLFEPEVLTDLLQNEAHAVEDKVLKHLTALKAIHDKLKDQSGEAFRLAQIHELYTQFAKRLTATLNNPKLTPPLTFELALELTQLLNYSKRQIHQQITEQGAAMQATALLTQSLKKDNPISHLKASIDTLRATCQTHTEALAKRRSTLQTVGAYATLALTQHTYYQFGYHTSGLLCRTLEDRSKLTFIDDSSLAFLREKYSPEDLRRLNITAGSACLGLGLYVSSARGYHFPILSSISSLGLSQLVELAPKLSTADQWIQKTLAPYCTNTSAHYALSLLRLDEIGLLEKERSLNWVSGLCLLLGFNLARSGLISSLPTLSGYVTGTSASLLIHRLAKGLTRHQKTNHPGQFLISFLLNLLVYPYAFRFGFSATHGLFATPSMTTQKALDILKLPQGSSEQEITTAYRKRALNVHPDHCSTAACNEEMIQLNQARQFSLENLNKLEKRISCTILCVIHTGETDAKDTEFKRTRTGPNLRTTSVSQRLSANEEKRRR